MGLICLCIAALCVAATVVGIIYSFNVVAGSASPPNPQDLATGISMAKLPSLGVVPFGVLGVILLVTGLLIRRPVD